MKGRGHGGPPWAGGHHRGGPGDWHKRGRMLFLRFTMVFGFMVLLFVGGTAAAAFIITRLFGGSGQTAILVWVLGLSLTLALPVMAITLAMRAFRRIASPLADIMAAADAVAEGDLEVRISERKRGAFDRLATSFNRMVDELQRTDRLRKNLTADVAHELRTPLHVIQGNLEGIVDKVYEPTDEHIGATLDETRLLARLVDDLNTLSLAESGQITLVKESVDIGEFLADVETAFRSQAETEGVSLEVESSSEDRPITAMADVGRMQQVLGNLIANALRHTDRGGVVTLRSRASSGTVGIEVEDTGEGIPPEDLDSVFDRFWRGDRMRSEPGSGGGLGLAIARQLVQEHGGTIAVRSELGRGTTFTIELPGIETTL